MTNPAILERDPRLAELVRRLVHAHQPALLYLFGSRGRALGLTREVLEAVHSRLPTELHWTDAQARRDGRGYAPVRGRRGDELAPPPRARGGGLQVGLKGPVAAHPARPRASERSRRPARP